MTCEPTSRKATMPIQTCPECGTKNRVDENAASVSQPVCGKCGEKLPEVTATASGASNTKPQVVTDATFASDVVSASASLPVLVDCWAPWCGPCRMIAPALEEIAGSLNGKVKILKLNVDENQATAVKYNVTSIPTLMLFKNGELSSRQIGAAPKQKLESWINGAA